jgi:DNA-binding response OmpR family regulator
MSIYCETFFMTNDNPQAPAPREIPYPDAQILVVDDESSIRRYLSKMLENIGYQVTVALSGEEALERIASGNIDLVILDLHMPGIGGTEVLETAQSVAPDTVFIILTGYGTLESAIAGIRHGAHDYLLKPSSTSEIASAVKAGLAECQRRRNRNDPVDLLQRALSTLQESRPLPKQPPTPSGERFLQAPGILIDLWKRLAIIRGEPVKLTPTEFDILVCLARGQNRVISCREIVAKIRGHTLDEQEARDFLRSHMYRLRQKIELDSESAELIRTVRGVGYMLVT